MKEEENETVRDYILISLYTGAGKSNVLSMRWTENDFTESVWCIPETKNGEPLTVALSTKALGILTRRREKTNLKWVFPSDQTETHFAHPKKSWKRILLNATIKLWNAQEHFTPLVAEAIKQTHNSTYDRRPYAAIQAFAKEKKMKLPTGLMDVRLHDLR